MKRVAVVLIERSEGVLNEARARYVGSDIILLLLIFMQCRVLLLDLAIWFLADRLNDVM